MAPYPLQWTDPRTWPWVFDVWAGFVLLGFAKPIWQWLRRRRAESWPSTQGRIESTEINQGNLFRTSSASSSVASFKYSYEAGGAKYAGTYKKQFGADEESEDFLRDLTGKVVTVQYNLGRPSCSYVLESSIESLLSGRLASAASPLEIRRYRNPLPIWFARFLPVFAGLALIGFVLSALVNVGTLTSRWTPPSTFWGLHVGIFVVFIPALYAAQKRVGSTHRKDFWKLVLKGAPVWMDYLLYAVFAYAAVIGIPFWIRAVQHPSGPPQSTGFADWTEFSVVWMVFYWASFAILYSALREERLLPRCVKGHPVLPGANFCSECGQPVLRA